MGSEDLLQLLVNFFTTAGIPFLQIENAYFARFVEVLVSLAPGYAFRLPCRTKFTTEVFKEAENITTAVMTELQSAPGKVSLAFDCWSSSTQLPFITVTGHYIDKDWKMRRQLVAFNKFNPPHNGERTAKKLLDIICGRGSWLNLKDKFLALTGDSAATNLKAMDFLEEGLSIDGEVPTWSGVENFLSCSSHVINLVAQDICAPFRTSVVINDEVVEVESHHGAPAKGIMGSTLSKLGNAARKRNQSPAFALAWKNTFQKFKVNPLKLIKATPTRWNSRFQQIDVALPMRDVYDEVTDQAEHHHFKLSENEWEHLEWLHGILERLNEASHKLSSSKDVTISEMLPLFNLIFDMLEDQIDSLDPVATTDNQYERQERLKGLKLARDKLSKYYAYTTTCPWYTFATSKFHPSVCPFGISK